MIGKWCSTRLETEKIIVQNRAIRLMIVAVVKLSEILKTENLETENLYA
jgi:hypothetical protein